MNEIEERRAQLDRDRIRRESEERLRRTLDMTVEEALAELNSAGVKPMYVLLGLGAALIGSLLAEPTKPKPRRRKRKRRARPRAKPKAPILDFKGDDDAPKT